MSKKIEDITFTAPSGGTYTVTTDGYGGTITVPSTYGTYQYSGSTGVGTGWIAYTPQSFSKALLFEKGRDDPTGLAESLIELFKEYPEVLEILQAKLDEEEVKRDVKSIIEPDEVKE